MKHACIIYTSRMYHVCTMYASCTYHVMCACMIRYVCNMYAITLCVCVQYVPVMYASLHRCNMHATCMNHVIYHVCNYLVCSMRAHYACMDGWMFACLFVCLSVCLFVCSYVSWPVGVGFLGGITVILRSNFDAVCFFSCFCCWSWMGALPSWAIKNGWGLA